MTDAHMEAESHTETESHMEIEAFRLQAREFIAANLPETVRRKVRLGVELSKDDYRSWERKLVERGWLVPHWPAQWGGAGWTPLQRMVFQEELVAAHAPELNGITYDMVGPVLVRFGSEEQKNRFLPKIRSLEHWWCQGYSEPNAGSDLASLTTSAQRIVREDGSEAYKVNGSKIWTSGAQYADWIFALVRTNPQARPQLGISVLLIDMKSPGVSLRPIIGIHGWHLFNQVFFDDVVVPIENRVGEENAGWTIAKSLLEFERLNLARVAENRRRFAKVRRIGREVMEAGEPLLRRPWFARRFHELEVRLETLSALVLRFRARAQAGQKLGPETGMLKLIGSQLIQDIENLSVDALGPATLAYDRAAHFSLEAHGGHGALGAQGVVAQGAVAHDATAARDPDDGERRPHEYAATASSRRFVTRGYTIAGGSSEIQHELLAKQVLGL